MYINKHLQYIIFSFLLGCVFFNSCKSSKKVQKPDAKKEVNVTSSNEDKFKIEFKTSKQLIQKMNAAKFNFTNITGKFAADVTIDDKTNGFNVSLRGKKDSILWLSFSLMGIEGARILATPDSVKFIDRLNQKYLITDYQTISKMFQADIDFDMLQAVLVGNNVEFFDEDERIHAFKENNQFVLSTIRKRKLKKLLNSPEELNQKKELVQRTYLENDSYKIKRNMINDFVNNRTFNATYDEFAKVDSLLFPFNQNFEIIAGKTILVKIKFSKVETTGQINFPFNIPSRYEPYK